MKLRITANIRGTSDSKSAGTQLDKMKMHKMVEGLEHYTGYLKKFVEELDTHDRSGEEYKEIFETVKQKCPWLTDYIVKHGL